MYDRVYGAMLGLEAAGRRRNSAACAEAVMEELIKKKKPEALKLRGIFLKYGMESGGLIPLLLYCAVGNSCDLKTAGSLTARCSTYSEAAGKFLCCLVSWACSGEKNRSLDEFCSGLSTERSRNCPAGKLSSLSAIAGSMGRTRNIYDNETAELASLVRTISDSKSWIGLISRIGDDEHAALAGALFGMIHGADSFPCKSKLIGKEQCIRFSMLLSKKSIV